MVGAKAEEVLGEAARDLHIPPDDWTEELLEGHEEFLSQLGLMRERVSEIVDRVDKREKLVQVSETVVCLLVGAVGLAVLGMLEWRRGGGGGELWRNRCLAVACGRRG